MKLLNAALPLQIYLSAHTLSTMDALLDQFDDLELQEQYEQNNRDRDAVDGSDSENEEDAKATSAPCSPSKVSEAGELTCAICLGDIQLENMAMVKGCDHIYCGHCILHWALHKEHPWCPQCKQPFSYLFTYRTLDGELSDFPVEESVVLLKRAQWFTETLRPCARSSSLLEDSILQDEYAWHDYADEYDLAEDEELEAFYFSSAAGRARILLGNRRFGEGGFMSSGRRQARPVPSASSSSSTNRKVKGKGTGKHVRAADVWPVCNEAGSSSSSAAAAGARGVPTGSKNASSSAVVRTPNANGGRSRQQNQQNFSPGVMGTSPHLSAELFMGSSPSASGGSGSYVYGSSPSGSGRRAKRNARRAAEVAASSTSPLSPSPSANEEGSGSTTITAAAKVEQAVVAASLQ